MSVTLCISNRNIKVLSVQGKQVKKWGNLDLPAGLVRDGLILNHTAVADAIIRLFKSTGIPKDKVIISLAGLSYTYRFLNMPRIKPALLDEAILRAVKKEISLSLDELYLSWQSLPGKGDEISYFVIGVPRNLIDALVETLKKADIEPHLMDLQPLALARAANRKEGIIVSLEQDAFDIIFISNGIPEVIHTINPRSEGATLEDNIKRLTDELNKTATFYQNRHPDSPLSSSTPLVLTGELAAATPAAGLLQSETEYPIEPLSPPLTIPAKFPVNSYITNIGLALKTIPRQTTKSGEGLYIDININLFDGKYRKPPKKPLPVGQVMVWSGVVLALVLLFPLYQSRNQLINENTGKQTEYLNLNRQLNLVRLITEENIQTDNMVKQITANATTLQAINEGILAPRGEYTNDFLLITGVMPTPVTLTSIEIDDKQALIHGETANVFDVVSYAEALEQEAHFPDVRINELDEENTPLISGNNTTTPESMNISRITFSILVKKET
jgi:Tfp pilus assembly PilM family ATPase